MIPDLRKDYPARLLRSRQTTYALREHFRATPKLRSFDLRAVTSLFLSLFFTYNNFHVILVFTKHTDTPPVA